jgi:hypothetical protein
MLTSMLKTNRSYTMNTTQLCCDDVGVSRVAMHRPVNPIARLWQAIGARWAAHLEAEREAHAFDMVADLNADTLRDIGAPAQLISRAEVRQEERDRRVHEPLRQWLHG